MAKISTYSSQALTDINPTDLLLGTASLQSDATKNFSILDLTSYLNRNGSNAGTTPATSGADGETGTFFATTTDLYVCIATNTWRRVAIAAF
jgi:hypothetical protein